MTARFPKPWFRPSRSTWFVTLDGKQINLGSDREEAFRHYHKLMEQGRPRPVSSDCVVAVIDAFLDWCQIHRSDATYHWYLDRLQLFAKHIAVDLRIAHLRPYHVQRWVDAMEGITGGTRRNYIRAAQRVLRWAEQQGLIDRSPLAHMEKPAGGKREVIVSDSEFMNLLKATTDQNFQDLLMATWETGCRPQESLRLEARHVDLRHSRWVFPPREAKGKGKPRIVYLTDTAIEITERLAQAFPDGRLFRNTRGIPWTTDAVNCRFATLQRKLGNRYCLYHLRHTWMNRMLTAGVDALTVAILAGHSDPSMLAKTYQHLSQNPTYLRQVACRASDRS